MTDEQLKAAREKYETHRWDTGVYDLGHNRLVLLGGGDAHAEDGRAPDHETVEKANALADELGMEIYDGRLEWWGYSEYTPDPGDVSVFEWRPKEAA